MIQKLREKEFITLLSASQVAKIRVLVDMESAVCRYIWGEEAKCPRSKKKYIKIHGEWQHHLYKEDKFTRKLREKKRKNKGGAIQ